MSNTKNQILEVSLSLFLEKGFDKTSITDILERLDIARGTLYYHFQSKESIMDAIINQTGEKIMADMKKISMDAELSVYEKLFAFFFGMNLNQLLGGKQMIDYLNQPQNALFHEKSNQMLIEKASPLLGDIINEGIEKNLFENSFPYETAEIILISIIGFLDTKSKFTDKNYFENRLYAFLYNMELMLNAEKGSFEELKDFLIHKKQGDNYE